MRILYSLINNTLRTIIPIAVALIWLACTRESKTGETENSVSVPVQLPVATPVAHANPPGADTSATSPVLAQVVNPDSDKPILPIKVLTDGTFHADEVWEGIERENWFGLFKDGQGYYLHATAVSARRVEDPVGEEEEGKKTGWELTTAVKDTVVLLMAGSNDFVNRRLSTAHLDTTEVYPGDTVVIKFGNEEYHLFATGKRQKETPDTEWYIITDYKLYLSAKIDGQWVNQLLVAHENFDDAMTRIVWAGDIDGDNRLDLIINFARHYNEGRPTLLLSKPAHAGKLLELSGQHHWVGC